MSSKTLFTDADVERILDLLDRLPYCEIHIEKDDLKLHVVKSSTEVEGPTFRREARPKNQMNSSPGNEGAISSAQTVDKTSRVAERESLAAGQTEIRASMAGTFYRAPSVSEPPFVEEGQEVKVGDPLCLIEVMKLYNTVTADMSGRIAAVLATNGELVEEGQSLFVLEVI